MNAVEVCRVSKSFGSHAVLQDISLSIPEGQIYGIVGRNGSGKTVLMKCILGFMRPDLGEITVWGKRIGIDCSFAPQTGMIIETPGFLENESGAANLRYLLRLKAQGKAMTPHQAMTMVGLDPSLKKPVSHYSLGMRQRLGIAQDIMEHPSLLILDEPMNGLDNRGMENIRSLLLSLREQGITILLASHNPLDIEILCDEVYEMDQGKIMKINTHIAR